MRDLQAILALETGTSATLVAHSPYSVIFNTDLFMGVVYSTSQGVAHIGGI